MAVKTCYDKDNMQTFVYMYTALIYICIYLPPNSGV